MKKKTILMVHNFYQLGGGEHTVFKNEVELLKQKGHKVITYTRDNNELKKSKFKLLLLPFTTIWSFKTYRDIKKIILKEGIDIVHCHNTFPLISPSVYYAARKLNKPVVQTIHNFRFICPNALMYRDNKICEECIKNKNFKCALKNKCYRNSKIQTLVLILMLKFHRFINTYNKINYIFLTEFNKNKFSNLIDVSMDNVFIKPNFVNNPNLKRSSKLEKKFIFYGRLDDNKGIKFLLTSWEKVSSDYELHIYGEGINENIVKEYSQKYKNIKYFGFQKQDTIFKDLMNSQCLLFTSELYEGFPMTIAESFSLGVPVLSSNIGNQNQIIKESNGGITYKLGDSIDFVNSINTIVNNNSTFSNNAKKYYNEHLSSDKNYKELVNIYEKAKVI